MIDKINSISHRFHDTPNLLNQGNLLKSHEHKNDYSNYLQIKEKKSQSWLGGLLGKLWNLPNTIIGGIWGLVGVIFGAKVSLGNNAIQFENHPFMLKGSAITIGNTISYDKMSGPDIDGDHERQHTYQGQALGPFYLIGHLLEGLQALIFDGNWHGKSNDLEKGPMNKIEPNPWKGISL